jgi:hypothetical protein
LTLKTGCETIVEREETFFRCDGFGSTKEAIILKCGTGSKTGPVLDLEADLHGVDRDGCNLGDTGSCSCGGNILKEEFDC